jgi:hypothetical protein
MITARMDRAKSSNLFGKGDFNLAQHDSTDGSQYDIIDPPWGEDRLFASLEEVLTAMDTAEDPISRGILRETAISINGDLVVLHGVDLSPF